MQGAETVLSVIRDLLYHPKMITGEPVTGKLVRRVRERADGKGPEPRVPRRRPISLGGGPSEKDQHHWHLVGGLPYRTPGAAGGPGKRTDRKTSTAPRSDPTFPLSFREVEEMMMERGVVVSHEGAVIPVGAGPCLVGRGF
jgi:hypothetical protein